MADGFDIDLSGAKELLAALAELRAAIERRILREVLRDAAKMMAKEIKALSPKGKTGFLRKGPKVRAAKRKRGRVGIRVSYDRTADGLYYANAVEFGSKNSGKSRKANQPPQAFMRKAYDRLRPQLEQLIPQWIERKVAEQLAKTRKAA